MDENINPVPGLEVNKDLEETFVETIDYEGCEVVRREFFSHTFEVSVSFRIDSIMFNTATLKKMPNVRYVQFIVNPEKKKIVIRSCDVDDKDAIRWCQYNEKLDKRTPKKILCRMFAAKVFDMMDWNIENRYKIQGNILRSPNEMLIVFDLNDTEVYTPKKRLEDGRLMKSKPYYPEGWRESFGLPVAEHERALDINILDGYARMQIIEQRNVKKPKAPLPDVDQVEPTVQQVVEEAPAALEEAPNEIINDTAPEEIPEPTPMEDALPYIFGDK